MLSRNARQAIHARHWPTSVESSADCGSILMGDAPKAVVSEAHLMPDRRIVRGLVYATKESSKGFPAGQNLSPSLPVFKLDAIYAASEPGIRSRISHARASGGATKSNWCLKHGGQCKAGWCRRCCRKFMTQRE